MQSLLARLLMLSVLFGNLAWAVDRHTEVLFSHDTPALQQDTNTHDDGAHGHACNHSCHGAFHLLGLVQFTPSLGFLGMHAEEADPIVAFRSLAHAPPTQPPRA